MTKVLSRTGGTGPSETQILSGCLAEVEREGLSLKDNWESSWEGDQDYRQWFTALGRNLLVFDFIYHVDVNWVKWEFSYKRIFLPIRSLFQLAFFQLFVRALGPVLVTTLGKETIDLSTHLRERKWVQEKMFL